MGFIIRGLAALALTSSLGACATITRGSSEQFTISSTPPGAQAHTSNGFSCESTPCSIRMPRKDGFSITVTKPGYKTAVSDVQPKLAGSGAAGFVGNALIGGVIGAAVDVGTGATLDLTPNPLHVDLQADEPAPAATPIPVASPAPAAVAPAATSAPAVAAPPAPPASTTAAASPAAKPTT